MKKILFKTAFLTMVSISALADPVSCPSTLTLSQNDINNISKYGCQCTPYTSAGPNFTLLCCGNNSGAIPANTSINLWITQANNSNRGTCWYNYNSDTNVSVSLQPSSRLVPCDNNKPSLFSTHHLGSKGYKSDCGE